MAIARVGVELVTGPAVAAAKKLQQAMGRVKAKVKEIDSAFGDLSRKSQGVFRKIADQAKKAAGSSFAFKAAISGIAAALLVTARNVAVFSAEVQRAEIALANIARSKAPEALDTIRGIVNDFNTPIREATKGFTQLLAASSAAGFTVDETSEVFRGLSAANTALGGSTQQLQGILLATTQVFSKGKVAAEELRGQIGERLPGAFSEFAAATGRSTKQLDKALEQGEVSLQDFVLFAERLLAKYEDDAKAIADGPTAAGDRLKNALDQLSLTVGPLLAKIGAQFQDFATATIKALQPLADYVANLFGAPTQKVLDTKIDQLLRLNKTIFEQQQQLEGATEGRVRESLKSSIASLEKRRDILQAEADEIRGQLPKKAGMPGDGALPPTLTADTDVSSSAGKLSVAKQRVDMSQKMFELSRRLRAEEEAGNERAIATVEHMVRMQGIRESDMKTIERQNELEESTHQFRQDIFAIDKKIADQRVKTQEEAQQAFKEFMEAEREAAQKRLEADPFFQMKKQLEELVKVENQVALGATAIGNAFASSFKSLIDGSKSGKEALADMMSSIAEHFLDMAAQIIAQQIAMILYGTIMKALGFPMPGAGGGGGLPFDTSTPLPGGMEYGALAEGGFVDRPTNALIGEGSEPEYVIPESKMRESMARYSRGSRGSSVIPENGGSGSEEGGGTAVAAPIDVRYSVERINSVDYVTADQFQRGMQSAAAQGAKQGEQSTLKRLQMSGSTRRRLGL